MLFTKKKNNYNNNTLFTQKIIIYYTSEQGVLVYTNISLQISQLSYFYKFTLDKD